MALVVTTRLCLYDCNFRWILLSWNGFYFPLKMTSIFHFCLNSKIKQWTFFNLFYDYFQITVYYPRLNPLLTPQLQKYPCNVLLALIFMIIYKVQPLEISSAQNGNEITIASRCETKSRQDWPEPHPDNVHQFWTRTRICLWRTKLQCRRCNGLVMSDATLSAKTFWHTFCMIKEVFA